MDTIVRKIFITIFVLTLFAVPFGSAAFAADEEKKLESYDDVNPFTVTMDVVIVRPISLVMIPVTSVLCVLALPYTLAQGNTGEVFDMMVVDTCRYTFTRPIGHDTPFN